MPRSIPSERLQQLIEVATEIFIAQGYRRTQMADVAGALGVAKGTLYGYVQSKAALFDAAVRHADGHQALPEPDKLPIKTPASGSTVQWLEGRMAAETADLYLLRAVAAPPPSDVRAELQEVLIDLYGRASRNRSTIKLVDRCASDYPDLAALWFGRGRWAQHELLTRYIRARVDAGCFRPVLSVPVAARMVLETVAFWAVHRHWDPSPQSIEEGAVEQAVIDLLTHSLTRE